TIGAGQGSNWWCVLFPPLCFLDFSAGTSVAEETDEATTDESEKTAEKEDDDSVEVKFFLFEWLGWSLFFHVRHMLVISTMDRKKRWEYENHTSCTRAEDAATFVSRYKQYD